MNLATENSHSPFPDRSHAPLLVRALKGENDGRPPVWLMRQAGRYMQEYRQLKEKHGFLGLCRSSELAVEVSLQPIEYLDPDAAIIFSDILIPVTGLGIDLSFAPGPQIGNPIRCPEDINKLKHVDIAINLAHVLDAISLLRSELEKRADTGERKAVIGFCGAPWTMACYLIDQGIYKGYLGTQIFATRHPRAFSDLLDRLADLMGDYLIAQIEAGADVVQLFDTWAGSLSAEQYRQWLLPSTRRIAERIAKTGCPLVLYINGLFAFVE